MDKQYYVYILGNHLNTVLYIGITNNLCKRVWEHKKELIPGFTRKYHIHNLIYYELFSDPISAIEREKHMEDPSTSSRSNRDFARDDAGELLVVRFHTAFLH
ncbi:GIY-YIG nuclease family protein [Candidatus Gottesmanbacteria bacterium]|nr:GIY-YIG nuclease family protein [Candidatus Gottesmanbacteria bacterium]